MTYVLGVIGGSGLYALDEVERVAEHRVTTPWGEPSSPIVEAKVGGARVLFLARHGKGHAIPPSEVNYRANVAALKSLGVTDLLAISACGSFREDVAPGHFLMVDQFVDRTRGRPSSFFGPGLVAHVSMADPVCARLAGFAADAGQVAGLTLHRGGTYLAVEGPQFGTRAESNLFRAWGLDVVGMTSMPEARLAREAELPYALCAMVTDYDCWHEPSGSVEVESVLAVMERNNAGAQKLLTRLLGALPTERTPCPSGIDTCLDRAIVTAPDARDPAMIEKLWVIAGRALG